MLIELTIILLIILLVPQLCRWCRVPSIVGLILAGMAVGSHGFGWIADSETIQTVGSCGMIYLMFLSGIEIDMNDFVRNRRDVFLFGIYTFIFPVFIGILCSRFCFHFSWATSLLLGSMYGSHTLMTYPLVSRYGVQRNRSVNITVGGTMFAISFSLLCLAILSGEQQTTTWLQLLYIILFITLVVFIFPRIATWWIKRNNEPTVEFVLILALLALSALLAEVAGLQAILGAFIAGVALNKRIPNLSPLMNRINFVGNSLLIPVFLVSVGLMIDVHTFLSGWTILLLGASMLLCKLLGKYLAALLARYTMHLNKYEGRLMLGLSTGSAAGTLAVATIGVQTGVFTPEVLNAAVILILFSCLFASFLTEHAAEQLALSEQLAQQDETLQTNLLVSITNRQTCRSLIDLALLTTPAAAIINRHLAHIIANPDQESDSRDLLQYAARRATAADIRFQLHTQVAANIANGISKIIDERHITQIVMGVNNMSSQQDYGEVIEHLLKNTDRSLLLYHEAQPLNTIHKLRIAVPRNAERESGFLLWFEQIRQLATQTGAKVVFYTNEQTRMVLRGLAARRKKELTATYKEMQDWEDVLQIAKDIKPDDMFIAIVARQATISYNPLFDSLPYILQRYFNPYNTLVIFPEQTGAIGEVGLLHELPVSTSNSLHKRLKQFLLRQWRKRQ